MCCVIVDAEKPEKVVIEPVKPLAPVGLISLIHIYVSKGI